MASKDDLNEDLSVGLTAVKRTLEDYGLGDWLVYLVVRKPAKAESYIILKLPSDDSDFLQRLETLHREHTAREQ